MQEPKIVWFIPQGRTGNNLLQYLAAEVIKHIYKFDIVQKIDTIDGDIFKITDESYTKITYDYMNSNEQFISDKNIVLDGYFQKSDILLYLRPHLLQYFNIHNNTYINDTYKISDFSNSATKHNIIFDDNTLVMHLRLDDFIHYTSSPNIFVKEELSKFIDTIKFTQLYIVCDKLRHDWEKKYVEYFVSKYQAQILCGSFLDDFNLLKITPRLVTSQSTFSWLAAYLGNATEVYIPYSNFYKDHQILKECHQNCILHYGTPFATFANLLDNINNNSTIDSIMNYNGQAGQDLFVLKVLNSKYKGTFLEIGSNHPIKINNTYLLENTYNWNGIMVEYDNNFIELYRQYRPLSKWVISDATKINYKVLFEENKMPENIDYLQIDLEVNNNSTLQTLKLLDEQLMDKYKFATVTFEHDIYSGNYFDTRNESRKIFEKRGYELVFPDVMNDGNAFEDWYVHPELVNMNYINNIKSNHSMEYIDIINKL